MILRLFSQNAFVALSKGSSICTEFQTKANEISDRRSYRNEGKKQTVYCPMGLCPLMGKGSVHRQLHDQCQGGDSRQPDVDQ
jgi:hypothetical protein